ncbi:MAG: M48 family metallopeptidase [Oscillospiraceae bacterium]|nr:M48 family metallopeptidase [Oscillospiraceae bacterium]
MIEYELIRSSRKSLGLEVKQDGRIIVRAPRWVPMRTVRQFVERHRKWIEERLQEAARYQASHPQAETLSEEELQQLVKEARRQITQRAETFAPLVGVEYERIAIRKQRTKWGSCSSKGNLNFNCLLVLAPPEVLDYVVVHELCHRKEMNHSPRFWAEVRRVLPDYEDARRWLRENGGALLARLPEK